VLWNDPNNVHILANHLQCYNGSFKNISRMCMSCDTFGFVLANHVQCYTCDNMAHPGDCTNMVTCALGMVGSVYVHENNIKSYTLQNVLQYNRLRDGVCGTTQVDHIRNNH